MVTREFTVSRVGAQRDCTHHRDCKSFIIDEKKRDQQLVLHTQRKVPVWGAELIRNPLGDGEDTCVWSSEEGAIGALGGGFTTGALHRERGQL